MLKLIGLGIHDEKDLSLRAIKEIKNSNKVFIELYTGKWSGNRENIEKITGKKIEILSRSDLEENSSKILDLAKERDVSILSQGDPLVFTTHISLLSEANRLGIKTRIIHNSSIFSAVAETGLHLYKFGASATVPFQEKTKGRLPESVYDVIKQNKNLGLHTLLLLDIDKENVMLPNNAIKIMLDVENLRKEKVFNADSKLIVLVNVGSEKSKMVYGKSSDLITKKFENLPSIIIVPGKLHFSEREFLESQRGLKNLS